LSAPFFTKIGEVLYHILFHVLLKHITTHAKGITKISIVFLIVISSVVLWLTIPKLLTLFVIGGLFYLGVILLADIRRQNELQVIKTWIKKKFQKT